MVDDVLQFSISSAGSRNVHVENLIPDNLSAVMADRIQLEQVLLNLILNAIEECSSDEGDTPLKVWVDADDSADGQVTIRVHDQGKGLPTEIDALFDQFFTTKEHGLGMGLAISRSLVEIHGGQIWAENAPDGGAIFSFTMMKTS